MEALFREEKTRTASLSQRAGGHAVGAFEGALYEERGTSRPQADCIMFTRRGRFCAVCRRTIEHHRPVRAPALEG